MNSVSISIDEETNKKIEKLKEILNIQSRSKIVRVAISLLLLYTQKNLKIVDSKGKEIEFIIS